MTHTLLHLLARGGKAALARALAQMERAPDAGETVALLDAAYGAPVAHVVGVTGPPGVGKSTLMNTLIKGWRTRGRTVGVIAVDPSSRRTGGALLGDRTRLAIDPEDQGVFIRSMAARDTLGGLAALTVAGMVLMRALYDMVLIETVGVGQSETDVVGVADTVVFCIQPGSGDSLQFMKAGIVEIPHIVLVTKADMGKPAARAQADVRGALSLVEPWSEEDGTSWSVPVLLVSAPAREGLAEAIAAIDSHGTHLREGNRLRAARRAQAEQWLMTAIQERFGREGAKRVGVPSLAEDQSPFHRLQEIWTILGTGA
ncbi:MAG: LAO/AO transport system kinase [Rhodospirillaceae bacterium]|nr:MAG: LAO/AO transport system kinase [Rhodospirillaceae bacterium]